MTDAKSYGISKKLIPWNELSKNALEVRVPCQKCDALNYMTGNNNAFYWSAQAALGVQTIPCQQCRSPLQFKKSKLGVELT